MNAARPVAFAQSECTTLDVRSARGGMAVRPVVEAADNAPPGRVLRLRALFKPVPLIRQMKMKGWRHWAERADRYDWRIWFYRCDDFA